MTPSVYNFFFLKTFQVFGAGLGGWLYVSPIAGLQETVFLILLIVITQSISTFLQWKKRSFTVEQSSVKSYFDWLAIYGSVYGMGGSVWYFNYSHVPMGELIISTTLAIVIGMLSAVFLEKKIWEKQLRKSGGLGD